VVGLPVLDKLSVAHPVLPDEKGGVFVQAVCPVDVVALELLLADKAGQRPRVREVRHVLVHGHNLRPVEVRLVVAPAPERPVQLLQVLEVQLCQPVELGVCRVRGQYDAVLAHTRKRLGLRRVCLPPVLHKLLVTHPVRAREQDNLLVHTPEFSPSADKSGGVRPASTRDLAAGLSRRR
jgi:hypothetical protein